MLIVAYTFQFETSFIIALLSTKANVCLILLREGWKNKKIIEFSIKGWVGGSGGGQIRGPKLEH